MRVTRSALSAPQTLIPRGAVWRYWDNPVATTLSTTATAPAVPASAPPADGSNTWKDTLYTAQPRSAETPNGWASGPAILGYSAPTPVTRLRCDPANAVCPTTPPSNKFLSYYFRTTVNVPAADFSSFVTFRLRVLRDDAMVVYVNGVERGRSSNLPASPAVVGYSTVATSAINTASWSGPGVDEFILAPSAFVPGDNVIAVELHQQAATSSDVAFDAELIGVPLGVIRGPFLQQGTPTSTVIRWRTNEANVGRIRIGPSIGVFTATFDEAAAAGSPFDHEVNVTGLTPGTRYYYSVGTAAGPLAGGDADHFFRTSPDPTAASSPPLRIWAFGDSGRANDGQRSVRDAFLPVHAARPTDLFIMLGDNAYDTGRDDEYQTKLFEIYPTLLRSMFLWPTHGNHEASQAHTETEVLASPFFNIFTLPKAAEAGGVPSGTERYYSWDWGNVHFISLDPQTTTTESNAALRTYPDTVPPGAPAGTLPGMLTWLSADLAANTRRWVIAYSHQPPYTKGTHNSDSSGDYESAMLRKYVLPRLEQYGADLMLSGHSHAYERSRLISGHNGGLNPDGTLALADSPSTTFDAATHVVPQANGTVLGRPEVDGPYVKSGTLGTIYAVVGTGGQVGSGPLNHPVMVSSFSQLGALIIDVDGDRLDAKFLNASGSVSDSFTVVKGATTNPWPAVSITSPASNAAAVNGALTVTAAATDADGIGQVTFFKNLVPVATVTAPPYEVTLTGLFGTGTVQLFAEATDALGARGSSLPVTVSLTVPPPGAPTGLTASPVAGAPGQISLTWTDPDNLERGFELERSAGDASSFASIGRIDNPSGTLPVTRTFIDSGLDPSIEYFYRVRGYGQTYGPHSNVASAVSAAGTPPTLVRVDSMWAYLDDNTSPLSWAAPAFDDSAWPVGLAELGYGDADEETVVDFGPADDDKYVTTYLRRSFTVVDPTAYPALTLRLQRDDGAVVYVNGTEVFRSNMPAGAITHGTFASSAVGTAGETTFFTQAVDPALLVAGKNVLAVEVHQSDPVSSDLSFSLELISAAIALAPGAPIGLTATGVSPTQINLSWTKNSTTETGFQIERSTDNFATATVIAITAPGASTFTDAGLSPSTQYFYRVLALSTSGASAAITASTRTCDVETCDGVDNDCDGAIDNTYDVGDVCSAGVGQCVAAGLKVCSGPTATACTATPSPPSTELCDELDNDCDGTTDNGFPAKGAACSAGVGACNRDGLQVCSADGTTTVCNAVPGAPAAEICDALDNDCDGTVDNDTGRGAACAVGVGACIRWGSQVCAAGGGVECDATPGLPAVELCDEVDNDCDGTIDNDTGKGDLCRLGTGACARTGTYACNSSGGLVCNAIEGAPSAELCDGEDNDCDGTVDEGFDVGSVCTVTAGGCTATGTRVCAGLSNTVCQLAPQTCQTAVYLHRESSGSHPRQHALTLDHDEPDGIVPSVESSGSLRRQHGNPWVTVATWKASPEVFAGTLTALAGNHLWLNDEDKNHQVPYDVKVDVYRNGTLLTSGENRCISLDGRSANDVQIPLGAFSAATFNGTTDQLTYKVSARMGTAATGAPCGNRNHGDGISLSFDSRLSASGFQAAVTP